MSRESEQDLLCEVLRQLETALPHLCTVLRQREQARGLARPSFDAAWTEGSAGFRALFDWLDQEIGRRHPDGSLRGDIDNGVPR